MGGIVNPPTNIGGSVNAPSIPSSVNPSSGFYGVTGGVGIALNGAGYSALFPEFWTLGNYSAAAFVPTNITGSPYAAGVGPMNVASSPNGLNVYVANSGGGGAAGLSAYTQNPIDGTLVALAGSPYATGATASWDVKVHPSGKFVFVSTTGIMVYVRDLLSGALTPVAGSPFALSAGATRPLGMTISPNGLHLLVACLGGVQVFDIDPVTGALTPVAGSPFAVAGAPASERDARSIAISSTGIYVYVASSLAVGTSSYINAFTMNPATGVLTPVAGSPYLTDATTNGAISIIVSPNDSHVLVTYGAQQFVDAYQINLGGALSRVPGAPFATSGGNSPGVLKIDPVTNHLYYTIRAGGGGFDVQDWEPSTGVLSFVGNYFAGVGMTGQGTEITPDGRHIINCSSGGNQIFVSRFSVTPSYPLIQGIFDQTGGLGGGVIINGSLNIAGSFTVGGTTPATFPALAGNALKKLRVNAAEGAAEWAADVVYTPVVMVANAGALTLESYTHNIVYVTGALTATGDITTTFPAGACKVTFNNSTTGAFALTLNTGTYTIPRNVSEWYWNGAGLVKVGDNTPDFTSADQIITSTGALVIPHGLGVVPSIVTSSLVCQVSEQGYTAGDIIEATMTVEDIGDGQAYGQAIRKGVTNIDVRFGIAGGVNVFRAINFASGQLAQLTNANWRVRYYAWR